MGDMKKCYMLRVGLFSVIACLLCACANDDPNVVTDTVDAQTETQMLEATTESGDENASDRENSFQIQPELILDTTVYNADSDPTIGWTVVAAEPGKALNCTVSGWLYRVDGDEKVLLGGVSQEIGLTATPEAPGAYASYHFSRCIHNLLENGPNGGMPSPPITLEPGTYLLEYNAEGGYASATFTVTETLTCPHYE